jgi:sarcosine oxidase subunit alpha
MVGHVTSSYLSPTLGRSIAMALVKGGATRMGDRVHIGMRDGRSVTATITSTVFFDPKGERQNA